MSVLYYSPWLSDSPRDVLGLYILAFFWFLVAWLFAVWFGLKLYQLRRTEPDVRKPYWVGLALFVTSYLVVGVGFFSGYIVTV